MCRLCGYEWLLARQPWMSAEQIVEIVRNDDLWTMFAPLFGTRRERAMGMGLHFTFDPGRLLLGFDFGLAAAPPAPPAGLSMPPLRTLRRTMQLSGAAA